MQAKRPKTTQPTTFRPWGSRCISKMATAPKDGMDYSNKTDSLSLSHVSFTQNVVLPDERVDGTIVPSATSRLEKWKANRQSKALEEDRSSCAKAIARAADIQHVRWLRAHTEPNGYLTSVVRDDVALPSFIERVSEWGGELKHFRRELRENNERERALIAAAEGASEPSTLNKKVSHPKPLWRDLHSLQNADDMQQMQKYVLSDQWAKQGGGGATHKGDSARSGQASGYDPLSPSEAKDSRTMLGSWLHIAASSSGTVPSPSLASIPTSILPPSSSDPSVSPHYGLYDKPSSSYASGKTRKGLVPPPQVIRTSALPKPPPYPTDLQRRQQQKQFHYSFEGSQLSGNEHLSHAGSAETIYAREKAMPNQQDASYRKGVVSRMFPFPLF
eukprot:GILI01021796.1.p1 GENE.GILI01021796.1~~GILI01021796.1.p1  ORF type:complete len:388 (+),score=49.26 GILI01021796.1:31-1194(+)